MEIGQVVKWQVGGKYRTGIFRQIVDGKAQVICRDFEGVMMALKCLVELDLIEIVNE